MKKYPQRLMKKYHQLLIPVVLVTCMLLSSCSPKVSYRGFTSKTVSKETIILNVKKTYNDWYKVYVKSVPGKNEKYVDYIADERGNAEIDWVNHQAVTVSEAHGYGMLILTKMAQLDSIHQKDYQKEYDEFVRFYQSHPSSINPTLMCWQMVGVGYDEEGHGTLTDVINTPNGADSATDGDLDIAYSLILADALWGSNETFDYKTLALNYLAAIAKSEFSEDGRALLGDWVDETSSHYFITRSSDLLLNHFSVFASFDTKNKTFWAKALDESKKMISECYKNYSQSTGLLPDFIYAHDNTYSPVKGNILEDDYDGDFNYNACRTPWRVADYAIYSNDTSLDYYLNTFATWSFSTTTGNPALFKPGYTIMQDIPGTPIPDRDWTDLSFTAPLLIASSLSAKDNKEMAVWYEEIYTYLTDYPITESSYFGNTIRLMVLIDSSGYVR